MTLDFRHTVCVCVGCDKMSRDFQSEFNTKGVDIVRSPQGIDKEMVIVQVKYNVHRQIATIFKSCYFWWIVKAYLDTFYSCVSRMRKMSQDF